MRITNLALAHKTSVFVLLAIIVIGGSLAYKRLPRESFPQIRQPVVYVASSYVGVAPSDMETLVVDPIEDRLQEIASIQNLTSTSREGYASVWAEFQSDIEIDEAVRKVREKVDQAKSELPQDMDEPIVQEINFENIPIMIVSIVGAIVGFGSVGLGIDPNHIRPEELIAQGLALSGVEEEKEVVEPVERAHVPQQEAHAHHEESRGSA